MNAAVVGHVEWVEFACVPRMPKSGDIVHATENWQEPGGGGAVAAAQLARLAGEAAFFTALAKDEMGRAAAARLTDESVEVLAAPRPAPQRRAFTHIDDSGERTITVIGERMVPSGDDELPWYALTGFDCVYFTGGDVGALRAARGARVLVATPRAGSVLLEADVDIDVLVHSAGDPGEIPPDQIRAGIVVATEGKKGGAWRTADGKTGRYKAIRPPAEVADAYGCGDAFAAGLTFALGERLPLEQALDLGARCGARALTGRGPYTGLLSLSEWSPATTASIPPRARADR